MSENNIGEEATNSQEVKIVDVGKELAVWGEELAQPAAPLAFNAKDVRELFALLDQIHLVAIVPDGHIEARLFGTDIDAAVAWAEQRNGQGKNIYWTVNVVQDFCNRKPKKEDIVRVRFADADLDPPKDGRAWSKAMAGRVIEGLPVKPSFVIDSGNGLQPFWQYGPDRPSNDNGEEINTGIRDLTACADACQNIDRLMRVPGTINYPNAKKAAGRVPVLAGWWQRSNGSTPSFAAMEHAFPPFAKVARPKVVNRGVNLSAIRITFLTADDLVPPPPRRIRERIENPKGHDRSREVVAVAALMFRKGYADQVIAGVLLNSANKISEHVLAQGDPMRAVGRAISFVRSKGEERVLALSQDADVKRLTGAAAATFKAAISSGPAYKGLGDLRSFRQNDKFMHLPTGSFWSAKAVNADLPEVQLFDERGNPVIDGDGNFMTMPPSIWLDHYLPIVSRTWMPGEARIIADLVFSEGGWLKIPERYCLNAYIPPNRMPGDKNNAGPWVELISFLYPADRDHIINCFAHRVQRPGEKLNHALLLGGAQGVGKDSILEPVISAVGHHNTKQVRLREIDGNYNPFLQSVILLIPEAADLGNLNRYTAYNATKTMISAPPETHAINVKYEPHYYIPNVNWVVYTTNNELDALYLPPEDRRHYIAWTDVTRASWGSLERYNGYFAGYYRWLGSGGYGHVAAYLMARDLTGFDAKAPPRQTAAWHRIVAASELPENSDLATLIDQMGNPAAFAVDDLVAGAISVSNRTLADWLTDTKTRRMIPKAMAACGYRRCENPGAAKGRYKRLGRDVVIYAKKELNVAAAHKAAQHCIANRPTIVSK